MYREYFEEATPLLIFYSTRRVPDGTNSEVNSCKLEPLDCMQRSITPDIYMSVITDFRLVAIFNNQWRIKGLSNYPYQFNFQSVLVRLIIVRVVISKEFRRFHKGRGYKCIQSYWTSVQILNKMSLNTSLLPISLGFRIVKTWTGTVPSAGSHRCEFS
jgi:hypothetical protein